MEIQEALNWTDDLIFAKTGKHLDSLQRSILEGVWEHQEYKDMAENYHCTVDHVRKTASELWKLLSNVLREDVKKRNFKSTLKRIESSNISNFVSDYVQIVGDINFCHEHCPYPKVNKATKTRSPTSTSTTNQPEKHHDLTEAPEYVREASAKQNRLYNRTAEITTLKQWILQENIHIVTIFGLPGIGKTALARELVEQIQDNFEYIIWRNCTNTLTLKSLQTNLMQFFSENRETQLPSLIDYLRSHSCLIILDDFQELFISGELAGTYLPDCQNYGKFFKEIACYPHQSCLLILSWEKPTEIATLEGENRHCRSLQLDGLGEASAEILTNKGLTDRDKWGELIQLYGGNPSWLNIIASTIEDLFNGSVDRYLSYPTLFLGDLEPKLEEYYQRLSASEKLVILWLANQDAADIFHKPADLALSDAEFLKAVQSLLKRGLIEKASDNRSPLFSVQALVKEYVKN